MAAAILRYLVGKRMYIQSAGVRPGETDPFAIAVMDEVGIDIARHHPRTIEALEDTTFDPIVTLAPEAHHKALEFTRTMAVDVEYWPTIDPSAIASGHREQILQSYRTLREQLFERIKARFGLTGRRRLEISEVQSICSGLEAALRSLVPGDIGALCAMKCQSASERAFQTVAFSHRAT